MLNSLLSLIVSKCCANPSRFPPERQRLDRDSDRCYSAIQEVSFGNTQVFSGYRAAVPLRRIYVGGAFDPGPQRALREGYSHLFFVVRLGTSSRAQMVRLVHRQAARGRVSPLSVALSLAAARHGASA